MTSNQIPLRSTENPPILQTTLRRYSRPRTYQDSDNLRTTLERRSTLLAKWSRSDDPCSEATSSQRPLKLRTLLLEFQASARSQPRTCYTLIMGISRSESLMLLSIRKHMAISSQGNRNRETITGAPLMSGLRNLENLKRNC